MCFSSAMHFFALFNKENMQLHNNTILITGGSSGIGLALATRFHNLGNKIIISGRDNDKLNQVKKSLPGIEIIRADLSKQTDIDALIVSIEQRYHDVNILINSAGIQYNYDFLNEKNILNKINYEITTNFTATVVLCGLLLPTLQKNDNAAIVNISSGLALSPKRSAPVYCSTKAAIHNFTKALRYQMEATHLKVFEIIPPLIDTPMTEGRGRNKISADQLASEFINNFKNNTYESYIGKAKLLKLVSRISPSLADRILKNS